MLDLSLVSDSVYKSSLCTVDIRGSPQWGPLEWGHCGALFLSNEHLGIVLTFSLHQICMFMEGL